MDNLIGITPFRMKAPRAMLLCRLLLLAPALGATAQDDRAAQRDASGESVSL